MSTKPKIGIGVSYDGFSLHHQGKHYWINQEDDPSVKLKELFEALGFEVEVSEEY